LGRKHTVKIKRKESNSGDQRAIIWTSFKFPPKKAKKLDDILKMTVRENSITQNKSTTEALQKLSDKAVNLGIMEQKKENKYFYHTEEHQAQAERDLL